MSFEAPRPLLHLSVHRPPFSEMREIGLPVLVAKRMVPSAFHDPANACLRVREGLHGSTINVDSIELAPGKESEGSAVRRPKRILPIVRTWQGPYTNRMPKNAPSTWTCRQSSPQRQPLPPSGEIAKVTGSNVGGVVISTRLSGLDAGRVKLNRSHNTGEN